MQTFLRRLEILNYLRQQRRSVSTDALIQHLNHSGHLDADSIKPRSQQRLVQRDMQFLLGAEDEEGEASNDFGLTVTRGQSKTLLWQLDPYQTLNYDFERMPAFMALALAITRKHLRQVLPSGTQQELARLFEQAESRLNQQEKTLSPAHYQRLTQSVAFFQRGQSLQAPDFDMAILDTLYRAILLGKRITFDYSAADGRKTYDTHPYGIVFMLPKVYLIGTKHDEARQANTAFRSFLVHRIHEPQVSRFDNDVPDNFSLNDFLQKGQMDVLIETQDAKTYTLELILTPQHRNNLIRDLQSSPISPDQQLMADENGTWYLNASVRRTIQLRNWLLSLGEEATILKPAIIREDLLTYLAGIQLRYCNMQ